MEVAGLTEEQRESLEQQLAKATADYEKMMADQSIEYMEAVTDAHQKQIEKRMKAVQFWGDFTKDMLNELTNLAGALFDAQVSEIEKEEKALDEKKDKDLERIEELEESKVITTEEAEARKRAAEQASERKHEELEKKKADIEYKKAVLEKANKVAQIGISTALGIMQALAMFPPNIPLSITVGAIGAVQLAAALAQPIKAYAKGTPHEGHHGGLAVVGDGGKPELVTFMGKSWITPDNPTLVNLPKGAHVYPDVTHSTLDDIARSVVVDKLDYNPSIASKAPIVNVNTSNPEEVKESKKTNALLKGLIKQNGRIAYMQRFHDRLNDL